jgi:hypothetical protein
MAIRLQRYDFTCTWQSEVHLPDYLGSALRGAFGWALKKSSCALKNQQCSTCLLRRNCAYAWVFETERYTDESGRKVNARPHPFIFQPGENTSGIRHSGDPWSFSLLLIDRGIDFLPHVVYSVQQMGETGIGAGGRHGRGRFSLEKIFAGDAPAYDSAHGMLERPTTPSSLHLGEQPPKPVRSMRVTLQTPLRLKQDNALQRSLPFHRLIRATLRRIASLEEAYGQGEPSLDYSGMVQRAEQVETTESTIRCQELLRFSNRQQRKVSLSGLIGEVEYRGELIEFVPLLEYASRVNLGKQTVFGLGQMTTTWK